jgi:hypothetical protein
MKLAEKVAIRYRGEEVHEDYQLLQASVKRKRSMNGFLASME